MCVSVCERVRVPVCLFKCVSMSALVCMCFDECARVCVRARARTGRVPGPGCTGGVRTDRNEYGDRSGDVNIISIIGIRHPRRSHKCVGAL